MKSTTDLTEEGGGTLTMSRTYDQTGKLTSTTQSVTLTFRKFNYGYTQQTRVGTGGTTMKWGHDITSNAEWGGGAR